MRIVFFVVSRWGIMQKMHNARRCWYCATSSDECAFDMSGNANAMRDFNQVIMKASVISRSRCRQRVCVHRSMFTSLTHSETPFDMAWSIQFVVCMALISLGEACIEQLLNRIDASEYGYTIFNGPETWGHKFGQCNGYRQSPVTLDVEECQKMRFPQIEYLGHADERSGGFRLHNTFQSVEIEYSGEAPTLKGGPLGNNFTFSQIHFHWGAYGTADGSEHQIKDQEHAMEAHLVHFNSKYGGIQEAAGHLDGLSIISLLFTAGKSENEEIELLVKRLRKIRRGDSYTLLESSAMTWLGNYLTGKYYTYWGSLTTPPCNEVVTWIVLENAVEIGYRQLEQFRMIYSHEGKLEQNVRPVQPMGKRYVFCPSEPEPEEDDSEADAQPDKNKEDDDSSEEDKLDSEESSEESSEDDDRKIKKKSRRPPLYATPKKLRSRPPTAFSTYTLVSG